MDYKETLLTFTDREQKILKGICKGNLDRKIMDTVGLSEAQFYIDKGNIYAKLGLKEMQSRKRRKETLQNVICPIFATLVYSPVNNTIESVEKPTPILDQESYALALYDSQADVVMVPDEIIKVPPRPPSHPHPPKRSPWPTIFIILVFAIMAGTIGYLLGRGNKPVPPERIVTATPNQLETQTALAIPVIPPTMISTATSTATSTSTITVTPSPTVVPTDTLIPTPTITSTPTIQPLGIGDKFSDNRVSLQLLYRKLNDTLWIGSGGSGAAIIFGYRFTNHSSEDILLRFLDSDFTLIDNVGRSYSHTNVWGKDSGTVQVAQVVKVGDTYDFEIGFGDTPFGKDVSYVIVSVDSFSSLTNMKWEVVIPE